MERDCLVEGEAADDVNEEVEAAEDWEDAELLRCRLVRSIVSEQESVGGQEAMACASRGDFRVESSS